jgi:hypothetical protein
MKERLQKSCDATSANIELYPTLSLGQCQWFRNVKINQQTQI